MRVRLNASTPRSWLFLFAAAGLAGAAFRVVFYLQRRSLWQDECFLSLNILSRPLTTLLGRPLDLNQTAPPLFLALEWISSRTTGASELSLRAPSLVAGLFVLLLIGWVACRIFPPTGALLALGLAAVSPLLVRYSAEVKPYIFDALATLVILGLVVELWRTPASRCRWRALLLAGFGTILLSTTAPFVLGPAWLALALSPEVRAAERARGRLALAAVSWGISWVALYLVSYRAVAASAAMQDFWRAAFLTLDPGALAGLQRRWTVPGLFGDAELGLPPGSGLLLLIAMLAGLVWIWRRLGRPGLVLVAGPVVLAYFASLLRRYPIEARLMSFAVPLLIILMAAAVAAALELARRGGLRLAVLATSCALFVPGGLALRRGGQNVAWLEEVRPLLADSSYRNHRSEPLYVFGKAMPAWIYYSTNWSSADPVRTARLLEMARRIGPNSGNGPSRGRAVEREGGDLTVDDGARRLLVGIPSGYQAVFRNTWEDPPVDQGWGANEAQRLLGESSPCGWILFAHHKRSEIRALDEALRALGARLDYQRKEIGAELRRYCRPDG